jgi:hypothetical protein
MTNIELESMTLKNFMSVGNQTQSINFKSDCLTLVLGTNLDLGGEDTGSRNGTGKTTMINGLSYLFFGEALSRIKKENLINKTNGKNLLATGSFKINGVQYRIERGRKPTFLKLYINDKEHVGRDNEESQGDSRETQKYIENLVGMSHTMFKHIVALNTYTEPFLSLKAADQREVIEELIGSTMLSTKAESLRLLIKETKDAITTEQIKIDSVKNANEGIQRSINSLIAKRDLWNKKQEKDLEDYAAAIAELESLDISAELQLHNDLKVWKDNNTQLQNLKKQKAGSDSSLIQADRNVKRYTNELEKLADNKCPQCDQDLHNDTHVTLIANTEKNLSDAVDYYNTVKSNIDELTLQINAIGDIGVCPKTFYSTEAEALGHQNQLMNLEKALIDCSNQVNPYTDQIEELEKTALQSISWDKINELTKLKEHQDFLLKLLTNKDSFIRKKIIDQNLAHLNHRLSYYLDRLKLPHLVKFKNDLEVEITDFGKDLDFDNLSRGERNRLILSMSFAFRDVWESLYQSVNLLFVDELMDSGMDSAGVEAGLRLLKQMAREGGKNIYLISHKDELVSRVDSILRVVKENGFTSYSNSTEPVGLL